MKSALRMAVYIAALAAVLVALPRMAHAAGEQTGRIVGKVFEEQTGAAVPGATITVSGSALIGAPHQTQTADDGTYEVPNLPPGTYDVEVAYSGVKPIKRRVLVRAGEAAPLEIAWSAELAAVETTVVQEERHLTRPDTAIAGATFSMEKQNFLPVPRQYQSVVTQAPGVNENAGGNPRVKGATDRANRVLIDGLDTTDPVTNTFSANINQDSLAAVQVITSGMEAKYNATGSIINLITASGSDDVHFDVSFYMRPKQLTSFTVGGPQIYEGAKLYDDTPTPPQQIYQGNFNIGGPIIRHQLWYSAGIELDYNSRVQPKGPPLNLQAPNRVFQNAYPRLKLTWAPSSQHKFMIEGLGDPTYIDYENNASSTANNTDVFASVGRYQGGWKGISEWDYFISQNVDTKVIGGYSYNSLDVGPQGKVRSIDAKYGTYPGFEVPGHINNADGTAFRNSQLEQITNRHRIQLDGALSWRTRWFEQSHEAEFGFQSSYVFHKFKNDFTGNGDIYVDSGQSAAGASRPLNTALCDDDPTVRAEPNVVTGDGCLQKQHNNTYTSIQRGYTLGFYAQDRWKPTGWLTVLPGLRFDVNRQYLQGGVPDDYKRTIVIGDRTIQTDNYQLTRAFGPRLTGILDITRDQKTIFQASYGRSTLQLPLTAPNGVSGSLLGQTTTFNWDQNAKTFVQLNTGAPPNTLLDSSGRTPEYSDEFFFRFSRELFRNTVGEIDYTYRQITGIVDNIEVNRIWDPSGSRLMGFVDTAHPNSVVVWTQDSRNYNKYSGFDLIFESRPTPNIDFYGLYTLSWTYGPEYDALAGSANQFGNPRQGQFYGSFSPVADVRHLIKTQTTYTWHGLITGFTINWRSGFGRRETWTATSTNLPARTRSPTGTDTTAGSNEVKNWTDFRIPDYFVVNLLLGYDFYELTRQHLILTVGMENLFDNFTAEAIRATNNPPRRFGEVSARPGTPFRTQLGIRYQY